MQCAVLEAHDADAQWIWLPHDDAMCSPGSIYSWWQIRLVQRSRNHACIVHAKKKNVRHQDLGSLLATVLTKFPNQNKLKCAEIN